MSIEENENKEEVKVDTSNEESKVVVNEEVDMDMDWEYLLTMSKETGSELAQNAAMIEALYSKTAQLFKEKNIESELEQLTPIMDGLYKTFADIAELLRKNMETHCEFDNNNNIINSLSGKIEEDNTDDRFKFINIANNYIFAQEQIADIVSRAYGEIVALLRTKIVDENIDKDATEETKNSFNSLYGEYEQFINSLNKQKEEHGNLNANI